MRASKNHLHIFKTYFKVLKKNIPTTLTYVVIFLILTTLLTTFNRETKVTNFDQDKYPIIFIDNDNTALSKGLKSYLSGYAEFIDKYSTDSEIKDALFSLEAKYIIKVPKGFTNDFMKDGSMQIEKTSGQDKEDCIYLDQAVKRYVSTAKLYNKSLPDLTAKQIADKTANDLKEKADVKIENLTVSGSSMTIPRVFFSFLCYGLINIIFLGVSSIMLAYNRKEISDRDAVSTVKPLSFSLQLFAGHLVFTLGVFICAVLLTLLFLKPNLALPQYWLFFLNLFCICFSLLSLSFFIGSFVRNRNVQNAITNVLSLGLSFFCGIFVPLDIMNSNVVAAARFTPTYWYVKGTSDISKLSNYSSASLAPIFNAMLIELAFAAAFFALSLAVSKYKQTDKTA